MDNDKKQKSFWGTLPGLITGFAALVTAIGGLITALYAAGLLNTLLPATATPTTIAEVPTLTATPTAARPPVFEPTDTPTAQISTATPTPKVKPMPDLYISEFALDPTTPTRGLPVSVRVGVYNRGSSQAGAFDVEWWAGENFSTPACTWQVDSLSARGGRILTCTYDGYSSWYSSLTTKAVADPAHEVDESDRGNNTRRMTISVSPASATPTPAIVPEDCLPYTPANLRIVDEGAAGWLLTDGVSRMLILDDEQDAQDALALAQRHTAHCFIGRDNTRPDRKDYIVEYWTGNSGLATSITQRDCISYDPANLQTVDEGASGWLLTDGHSRMLILDNERDAQNTLILASRYTNHCFIGRDNARPNRGDYIVAYWE